jgi:hypothetical protein
MKVLTPCVQNCRDADVGSKVHGIGSNDGEGLGDSFQQQAIDDGLVLVGDPAQRRRQPEHQVKIRHGQELGFTRRKPCRCRLPLAFSAVPVATGIIGDPRMFTFLTAFDMTAELGSSANLDRLHNAPLRPVDVADVGTTPRLAVAAEDVRYFQFRPEHVHPLVPSHSPACRTLARAGCRPAPSAGPAAPSYRVVRNRRAFVTTAADPPRPRARRKSRPGIRAHGPGPGPSRHPPSRHPTAEPPDQAAGDRAASDRAASDPAATRCPGPPPADPPRAGPRPRRARNPQGLKRKLFRPPFTHRVSTRPRGMPAGAELPGRPQPPRLRKNSRRPPTSSRAPQIPPRNPRPRSAPEDRDRDRAATHRAATRPQRRQTKPPVTEPPVTPPPPDAQGRRPRTRPGPARAPGAPATLRA